MTRLWHTLYNSLKKQARKIKPDSTSLLLILGQLTLFCPCFNALASPQNGGTWTEKTSMPAASRVDHTACAVNDKIYVMGGAFPNANGDLVATLRMDIYFPATDGWSRAANLPTPRVGLGCAVMVT